MLTLRIPPPVWMLLAGSGMWLLDRGVPVLTIWPTPWNRLGWTLMAAAVVQVLAAMRLFRNAETTVNPLDPRKTSRLVTGGIYRWSRNPMYLGLALLLIGWAMDLGSLSPWLVPPLFVLVLTRVQILPEERILRERFGEGYDSYCRSVGRWIGRSR
jgi:protein-S-isoprenylcysteine O-methyltransferase Ste14